MRIPHKLSLKNRRGFTLVELMIVVAIIGVLAAIAIYGVRRYLSNAKSSEARSAIGRMAKDQVSAYEREVMTGAPVALGDSSVISRSICPAVATTVPATLAEVANGKYQSSPEEWKGDAGWDCLRFSMNGAQYYRYNFSSQGGSTAGQAFQAQAEGDLDGDTIPSLFVLAGQIQADPANANELVVTLADQVAETNPDE